MYFRACLVYSNPFLAVGKVKKSVSLCMVTNLLGFYLPCFLFFLFLSRERGRNGERPQTLHCYFLCSSLRCGAAIFNSTQHSPLRILQSCRADNLQSCRADNLTSSLYYSLCNIHLHTLIFYFVLIFIRVLIFILV